MDNIIKNEKSASFPGSTSTIKGIQTVYKQHTYVTNYNNYNIISNVCKGYKNIPNELKQNNAWIRYNLIDQGREKLSKIPYLPNKQYWAKVNNSDTWGTYNSVISSIDTQYKLPVWMRINPDTKKWDFSNPEYIKYANKKFDGIGYVFSDNDVFVGIDYDNWFDKNGNINDKCKDILSFCNNSYTELSQSKKGGHTIVKLSSVEEKIKLSKELNKRYGNPTGVRNDDIGIECYFTGRYFVMTGNVIENYTEIKEVDVDTVLSLFKGIRNETKPKTQNLAPRTDLKLDDQEILDLCNKAKNNSKFLELYNEVGKDGNSEGDLALTSIFSFYTQDVEQIKSLLYSSNRVRDKWEQHPSYLDNTIRQALSGISNTYEHKKQYKRLKVTSSQTNINQKLKRVFDIFIEKIQEDIKYIEYKLEKERAKKITNEDNIKELEKGLAKLINAKDKLIEELETGKAEKYLNKMFEIQDFEEKTKYFKKLTLIFYKLYMENDKINTYYLSEIISLYFPMFYWGSNLYVYYKGVYKKSEEMVFDKIITFILRKDKYIHIKREILDNIKALNHLHIEKFNDLVDNKPNVMNFRNGLVVFDEDFLLTGSTNYKIYNHTPNYLSILQMSCDFDATMSIEELEEKTPMFQRFLNTSLNTEEERQFAIEKLAYTFFNDRVCEEITYICGKGGNGKGLFERILKSLHNTSLSNPDIVELTDQEKRNNFFAYKLIGSPAIFTTEAKKDIKDTSIIKKISGNDSIDIEIKHSKEIIKMAIKSKLFISTNHDIKFREWTNGDERRAHFLEMNNNITPDKKVEYGIMNELKYITMLIVKKGLLPLIERCFQSFTLPESHFRLMKLYQEHNNNILSFINNHISIDKNGKILKSDIFYLINKEFTNLYRNKKNLFDKFENELRNQKIEAIIKKGRCECFETGNEKAGVFVYMGIRYDEFKEEEERTNTEEHRKELEYENMTDSELEKKIVIIKNILNKRKENQQMKIIDNDKKISWDDL